MNGWVLLFLIIWVGFAIVGSKKGWSKTISYGGGFLASLAVFSFLAIFAVPSKPSYTITAKGLYQAFEDNEIAATSKYKDRLIHVTGQHRSGGVGSGNTWILLDTGSSFFTVQCFLEDNSISAAGRLKRGQTVEVAGVVRGQTGNVMLDDCNIL